LLLLQRRLALSELALHPIRNLAKRGLLGNQTVQRIHWKLTGQ
jgi:hypothetical protein